MNPILGLAWTVPREVAPSQQTDYDVPYLDLRSNPIACSDTFSPETEGGREGERDRMRTRYDYLMLSSRTSTASLSLSGLARIICQSLCISTIDHFQLGRVQTIVQCTFANRDTSSSSSPDTESKKKSTFRVITALGGTKRRFLLFFSY